jgi:hypothetical protein
LPFFPGRDSFRAVSSPTWEFEMEGAALSSFQENGSELRLHADKIRCQPVKRGGITFVNYSRLIIENARISLQQGIHAQTPSPDLLLKGPSPNELLNIFSDLVGGSKRYILGKEDLENRPEEARVVVEISVSPLTLEIRAPGHRRVKVRAGHCLFEMGKTGLALTGDALIRTSEGQKVCGKGIHILGSLEKFVVEGPYLFETEGELIEGENGLFVMERGRLRLTEEKFAATNDVAPLSPVRFFDAFLARGMASGKSSASLDIFSRLFLGSLNSQMTTLHHGRLRLLKQE